jgi:hypothetical protein
MIELTRWKYFEEAEFIWNGQWNDPQLRYKGRVYNIHLIEDVLWDRFNEYAEEEGIEPNEENYTEYCHINVEEIRELFEIE